MKKFLLAIASLSMVAIAQAQNCTELFFSEIVEGTGNNKAIEIYNPTPNAIALSNYRIVRYSNGSSVGTDSLQLSGTIAAHDVWVVANGQTTSTPSSPACDPALQAMADQLGGAYPDPLYENGDDAIILARISPYAIIDIFGKIGEQPATAWSDTYPYNGTVGTWITKDHTMIRKPSIGQGVTANPTVFNVMAAYDTLPKDNWSNLGMHLDSICFASGIAAHQKHNALQVYPNPATGVINLSAANTIVSYEIVNAVGEVTRAEKISGLKNEIQVDIADLPPGLYFVEAVLDNGQRSISKLTVQ